MLLRLIIKYETGIKPIEKYIVYQIDSDYFE